MADTGFVIAGAGDEEDYAGADKDWNDPSRITADDGSYASSVAIDNQQTWYLKASSFDLSAIGASDTIDGVEVRVQRYATPAVGDPIVDFLVYLRKGDGGTLSNNKSAVAEWPEGSSNVENKDFGGASDTWGLSLSQSDLSTLQFLIAAEKGGAGGAKQAFVDAIWMKVYYTPTGVDHTITLVQGDVAISGSAPTISVGRSVPLVQGDIAIDGKAPTIEVVAPVVPGGSMIF